jgi:protein gp37
MSKPFGDDAWWDCTYNPVAGCRAVSPGCTNCYAAFIAGTYTWPTGEKALHHGLTVQRGTRRIFNGKHRNAAPRAAVWALRLPHVANPKLCPGQPLLIFVGDMADLFYEPRPQQIINRVCGTIVQSEHIGLLLTKRTGRMREHFTALDARTVRRWQQQLRLGFSAENQEWFDKRWPDFRQLADAGWFVFVSIAPMTGPATLPPDFLALGQRTWVIVAGEQPAPVHEDCRPMEADWARTLRDQCKASGIPFFMKQMARKEPIPPDLQIREFPSPSRLLLNARHVHDSSRARRHNV